eukprot:1139913-Pelagomonas_calceolata.AAC.1
MDEGALNPLKQSTVRYRQISGGKPQQAAMACVLAMHLERNLGVRYPNPAQTPLCLTMGA